MLDETRRLRCRRQWGSLRFAAAFVVLSTLAAGAIADADDQAPQGAGLPETPAQWPQITIRSGDDGVCRDFRDLWNSSGAHFTRVADFRVDRPFRAITPVAWERVADPLSDWALIRWGVWVTRNYSNRFRKTENGRWEWLAASEHQTWAIDRAALVAAAREGRLSLERAEVNYDNDGQDEVIYRLKVSIPATDGSDRMPLGGWEAQIFPDLYGDEDRVEELGRALVGTVGGDELFADRGRIYNAKTFRTRILVMEPLVDGPGGRVGHRQACSLGPSTASD